MSLTLRAGFASADLTPPVGVELCGFGWNISRVSTGIVEPLRANAFVWERDGVRGAIVSCDLIGIALRYTEQVRRLVEAGCGIAGDHVMIACTHTHSAPTTVDLVGWGEEDEDYLAGLPQRIAQAVIEAAGKLTDVEVAYGEAEVEGISYNRESHTKTNPGGLTDRTLKVLKFMEGSVMVGFLAHYSCHPVVMCEKTSLISGDFTGVAINKLSAKYGAVGLFLQGSIGDQNPVYCHEDQETSLRNLEKLAGTFAGLIEEAFAGARPLVDGDVSVRRVPLELETQQIERAITLRNKLMIADMYKYYDELPVPVQRRIRFERDVLDNIWAKYDDPEGSAARSELQAIRFGDVVLVAHPTELFFEYHLQIEQALAPYKTFIVGIANDGLGYVPTPDKYDVSDGKYSYPAWFTPYMVKQHPYTRDVGAKLSDAIIRLGKSM